MKSFCTKTDAYKNLKRSDDKKWKRLQLAKYKRLSAGRLKPPAVIQFLNEAVQCPDLKNATLHVFYRPLSSFTKKELKAVKFLWKIVEGKQQVFRTKKFIENLYIEIYDYEHNTRGTVRGSVGIKYFENEAELRFAINKIWR